MRCPSRCPSHWTWVLQLTWRVRNCLPLQLCEYIDIVFLICLMFIFELPIQLSLFRIHFVSLVIKCVTCQLRFWINYWRAWMDNGDNTRCDIYLILPSSISAVLQAEEAYTNCSGPGSVCLFVCCCLLSLFFVFFASLPLADPLLIRAIVISE